MSAKATVAVAASQAAVTPRGQTPDVTIIGAGVAGLSSAIRLARLGLNVEVIDEQEELLARPLALQSSFNLTLNHASRMLLAELNVSVDGQVVRGRQITARDGRVYKLAYGARATDVLLSVPRHWLLAGLYRSALDAGVKFQTGTRLVELNPRTGTSLVQRARTYVTVSRPHWVCADGVFSISRYFVARSTRGSMMHQDSGTSYIALTIPPDRARAGNLDPAWIQFSPGRGATAIGLPNSSGSVSLVVEWSGNGVRRIKSRDEAEAVVSRFENRRLLDLVPNLCESLIGLRIGRFSYVTNDSWWTGKAVLVGDSAHATPPYLGTGANSALLDAYVYAKYVESRGSLEAAMPPYEEERGRFFGELRALAREHERAIRSGRWGGPMWRAAQRVDATRERLLGQRTAYQRMVFDLPAECVRTTFHQASKNAPAG